MSYRDEYIRWLEDPAFDEATKAELYALRDEGEIEDRFYRSLSFGTGGLRGKLGAGTNRMNKYTVGRATQGLADYLNAHAAGGSAVIAYDSRHLSREFALDTALILAANRIKAYLFEGLRPTPELSFAVRELKADAGIVITASHNPPEYNGYKVYLSDGGQIVPPYDRQIIACVDAVGDFGNIRRIEQAEAERSGLLVMIGEALDRRYLDAIKQLSLAPDAIARCGRELRIVYTPLHGTGNVPVVRILKELGFPNVFVVPEQEAPDGDFTTLALPNPEDPRAFGYALRLARERDADLVLATDPDADRLGVYAKDTLTGEYMPFTGNMSGLLLAEYVLSQREKAGLLPKHREDGALVTTVVSSKMARAMADAYGLTFFETLTGFKYIGECIGRFEEAAAAGKQGAKEGAYRFQFGFEESYGCLAGTYARDKDAVAAVALLAEAAAFYRSEGLTLCDQMRRLYQTYGCYEEDLHSLSFPGAEGDAVIRGIMHRLRTSAPEQIGGLNVVAVRDYLSGVRTEGERSEALGLPLSNVLYFELENEGWCCVRPSGTEPKIKFYFGAKERSRDLSRSRVSRIREDLLALADGSVLALENLS